jgi:hypothetical protein
LPLHLSWVERKNNMLASDQRKSILQVEVTSRITRSSHWPTTFLTVLLLQRNKPKSMQIFTYPQGFSSKSPFFFMTRVFSKRSMWQTTITFPSTYRYTYAIDEILLLGNSSYLKTNDIKYNGKNHLITHSTLHFISWRI